MKVKDCSYKTKCEINGCKNLADFSIHLKQDAKAGINICKDCSNKLYSCLGEIVIPKSIPAPFKNQKKVKVNKV